MVQRRIPHGKALLAIGAGAAAASVVIASCSFTSGNLTVVGCEDSGCSGDEGEGEREGEGEGEGEGE